MRKINPSDFVRTVGPDMRSRYLDMDRLINAIMNEVKRNNAICFCGVAFISLVALKYIEKIAEKNRELEARVKILEETQKKNIKE